MHTQNHKPTAIRRSQNFLAKLSISLLVLLLELFFNKAAGAVPHYGDPNQPYDKIPGTLETYHVKWAKPLAGGKLKVLFLLPYYNAREVVELAQRLELDYTVIMNAGENSWEKGYYEGANPTPLYGAEATTVLNKLATERLDLTKQYDAIIIGKVRWTAIPENFRGMILSHVEQGTGLVYVSPSAEGTPADFEKLFLQTSAPGLGESLTRELPTDIMSSKIVTDADFKQLPTVPLKVNRPQRQALTFRSSSHGKGKIIVFDYHDGGKDDGCNILTSKVFYDPVKYDFDYALLTRAVLQVVGREPTVRVTIRLETPPCSLTVPEEDQPMKLPWGPGLPITLIARSDLEQSKIKFVFTGKDFDRIDKCAVDIRNDEGANLQHNLLGKDTDSVDLRVLARGNYTVDVRLLDSKDCVLDFASRSFRVEDDLRVTQLKSDKSFYERGEKIHGTATFSRPLLKHERAIVSARDTWGQVVQRVDLLLNKDRNSGVFSIPVDNPLSRLWDLHCIILDAKGIVDKHKIWVGLPDWNFDDYIWPLIFSTNPDNNWKGDLYTKVVRDYGINASNVYLIYAYTHLYELNERQHLQSISYAEHLGQAHEGKPFDKEYSGSCMAEFGRMAREIADTGQPLDPTRFQYKWGQWKLGAGWINDRVISYKEASKFGSPYFFLTGEEYLSGEFNGQENSCFCPLCTGRFQEWCKDQYKSDLKVLNAEWGSEFTSWDQVRGILLVDAVEKNQLPRWVDFRYFMRSRVWSQFFIDWTDMMRRVLGRDIRTGTNGHDHHDFSRYRNHMTSGKLYVGQEVNSEWHTCVAEELHQSFSGDQSFLLAAQSMMTYNTDFQTELDRTRLPWKMLFAGYRGFDWEQGLGGYPVLGGMSCVTPDYSEALPFFKDISKQVKFLQRGIAKLAISAKPYRSPVAILWAPYNHYISRLLPFQENGFSGGVCYNISVDGGAIGDCLVMMKSLRLRPTFLAPEDLVSGALKKRGLKALVLPYNKGMSEAEAKAIRDFVKEGGLVLADNEPATYSEHGRKLEAARLADLFPILDKENIVSIGKGLAAYLPNGFNGYLGRFDQGNYKGSDSVAALLAKYAKVSPLIELIDSNGIPRRDTLMPVFVKGSALYLGLLRHSLSQGKDVEGTTVKLKSKYHVWDVRESKYLGYTDAFNIRLDLYPKFFALLPANPQSIKLTFAKQILREGEILKCNGTINIASGTEERIKQMGQVVHVEVDGPDGKELEWYRTNLVLTGPTFSFTLPIGFPEVFGKYTVRVEYPVCGLQTKATFTLKSEPCL